DLGEGGLTEEEFLRAKGHMKGAFVLSLEDTSGRMSRLGKSELAQGEILSVDETLERIDAVSLDDARRVAERVFTQPMALSVIGPFDEGAFGGTDAAAETAVAAHHGSYAPIPKGP